MKIVLLIPVAAGLLLAGCSQSSSPSNPTATNNATSGSTAASSSTTPNAGGVLGQVQNFSQEHIDLAQVGQAVQQFDAAEGHYPKNLQELVPNYLAKIPPAPPGYKISYDPSTGKVGMVQQ